MKNVILVHHTQKLFVLNAHVPFDLRRNFWHVIHPWLKQESTADVHALACNFTCMHFCVHAISRVLLRVFLHAFLCVNSCKKYVGSIYILHKVYMQNCMHTKMHAKIHAKVHAKLHAREFARKCMHVCVRVKWSTWIKLFTWLFGYVLAIHQ